MQTFDGKLPPDYAIVAPELRKRGVEVVTIDTAAFLASPPHLTATDLVVGDFSWTRVALRQLGVVATAPDYPECLRHLLLRRIWTSTLGEVNALIESRAADVPAEVFIKPAVDAKAFSAIFEPTDGMLGALLYGIPEVMEPLPASLPVHCAEVVKMVSEYRVYVVNGEIRAVCHYRGPKDDKALDMELVREAVRTMAASEECKHLAGCSLDFATMEPKEAGGPVLTCLVEVNDGFSLGRYEGLSPADYTDLLVARWATVVAASLTLSKT